MLTSNNLVGAGGLEPPLLSELEPKSSVSAISPRARKKCRPTNPMKETPASNKGNLALTWPQRPSPRQREPLRP